MTEFNVRGKKRYLSPILDLYNRAIRAGNTRWRFIRKNCDSTMSLYMGEEDGLFSVALFVN